MATGRIDLLWGLDPALTTRLEPATVEDANDLSGYDVATIDDGSVDDGVWWRLPSIPQELIDGSLPKLVVRVKTPATSGNFRWLVNYRSIATAESGDPSTWQATPNSGNIAVPATARLYKDYATALTLADMAVDDVLIGEALRELSNAGDTVADVAVIVDVFLEYTKA